MIAYSRPVITSQGKLPTCSEKILFAGGFLRKLGQRPKKFYRWQKSTDSVRHTHMGYRDVGRDRSSIEQGLFILFRFRQVKAVAPLQNLGRY